MADMEQPYYVYILHCADGTLYTGVTNDVAHRLKMHNAGKGAKYTRGRAPVTLVYQELCINRAEALRRELAVKRLPRGEKEKLIGSAQTRGG